MKKNDAKRSKARKASRVAGKAARVAGRTGVRTARTSARTARDHPREAASGAGIGAVVAGLVSAWVVLKVVRSRRVRRLASTSAERGAFGPGVATASKVAHHLRDQA